MTVRDPAWGPVSNRVLLARNGGFEIHVFFTVAVCQSRACASVGEWQRGRRGALG